MVPPGGLEPPTPWLHPASRRRDHLSRGLLAGPCLRHLRRGTYGLYGSPCGFPRRRLGERFADTVPSTHQVEFPDEVPFTRARYSNQLSYGGTTVWPASLSRSLPECLAFASMAILYDLNLPPIRWPPSGFRCRSPTGSGGLSFAVIRECGQIPSCRTNPFFHGIVAHSVHLADVSP